MVELSKSQITAIVILSLGLLNVIFALVTMIHAGTGMGSGFTEARYQAATLECAEAAKTYSLPETCDPAGEKLQCGTEICDPGYYCGLDDQTAAPSTCRLCYGASVIENLKFGVTQITAVNQRCGPSGYTQLSFNAALQQTRGVYMCVESTECLSVNCQAPNGEARRLASMTCPTTNTFANDKFKKQAGGASSLSLCVAPAVAAAVFVLIGTGAAAAAAYFALKGTLQSEHELYAKIGMGGAGGAAAITLFCLIAAAAGMASFHSKMLPTIDNYNENAAPVTGNPAPNPTDLEAGLQVGGCPESCREVKYAAAAYFAAWNNYGTANVVFLVFMLIFSLGMTAATIYVWRVDDGPPQTRQAKSPKKTRDNPMTIIAKNRPKSAATRKAPTAPQKSQPPKPPRKSTKGQQLVALYSFEAGGDDELTFEEGDLIELVEDHGDGWGTGRLCDGSRKEGLFPMEYCSGAGGRV